MNDLREMHSSKMRLEEFVKRGSPLGFVDLYLLTDKSSNWSSSGGFPFSPWRREKLNYSIRGITYGKRAYLYFWRNKTLDLLPKPYLAVSTLAAADLQIC